MTCRPHAARDEKRGLAGQPRDPTPLGFARGPRREQAAQHPHAMTTRPGPSRSSTAKPSKPRALRASRRRTTTTEMAAAATETTLKAVRAAPPGKSPPDGAHAEPMASANEACARARARRHAATPLVDAEASCLGRMRTRRRDQPGDVGPTLSRKHTHTHTPAFLPHPDPTPDTALCCDPHAAVKERRGGGAPTGRPTETIEAPAGPC